jgi:hypothetical protein
MADPKGLLMVPVAFRSDGSIHALELDTSDRLKVVVDSYGASIAEVGRPLNYSRRISERKTTNGVGAGNTTTDMTVVAASKIQVIQSIMLQMNDPVARSSIIYAVDSSLAVATELNRNPALVTNVGMLATTPIVLAAGDNIRAIVQNLAIGQSMTLSVWGYELDIVI